MPKPLYAIAGATGAIGRRLSELVLSSGGTPLLISRSPSTLAELSASLGNAPTISDVDFADPTAAAAALADGLKRVEKETGGAPMKGGAYAVGSIVLKPLRGCSAEDFVAAFTLNVVGAAILTKALLPALKKHSSSEDPAGLVFFSSVAAKKGLANHAVVSAAKGGVEGLAAAMAAELAPSVRVNVVAPSLTWGGSPSEMAATLASNEKVAKAVAAAHALPRLGRPDDVAQAAMFLMGGGSQWTTGAVLNVDGGRSTVLK